MANGLIALAGEAWLLLLLINILLIVLGTAIKGTAALIILTPIFVPVVTDVEIDARPSRHRARR